MSTVTQWKRSLRPGVRCQVVDYKYPDLSGLRTVIRVQSGRFSMTLPEALGRPYSESWLDFPKARECSVEGKTLTWHVDWDGETPWPAPGRRTVTILEDWETQEKAS